MTFVRFVSERTVFLAGQPRKRTEAQGADTPWPYGPEQNAGRPVETDDIYADMQIFSYSDIRWKHTGPALRRGKRTESEFLKGNSNGAPGAIRTPGLRLRRPSLYPLSYRRTLIEH